MPYVDEEREVRQTVFPLLGENTAAAPTALQPGQWRYTLNGYQNKLGSNAKRPGSVPVTSTPLSATIERLTVYRNGATEKLLAASGTSLYKFDGSALVALTGALNSANIYDANYTDQNSNSRKLIADGASLKEYNDATETVIAVVPDVDLPAPAPPNYLSTINTKGIKYLFSYLGYVFASDGSDTWWYSTRYNYNYFDSTHEIRWVRENDFMNGTGLAFDSVLLLPMRRGWGILEGDSFDTFVGNKFLNTRNGVIAPRSIQRVTYPDGVQSILYLSDDGVYEIYDTGFMDTGSRRYSTRSVMKNIDFAGLGLTEAEKTAAMAYFDEKLILYMLKFNKGTDRLVYCFDLRNGEWYPWNNIKANSFARIGENLYYAGETMLLHVFDDTLADDWDDAAKTTGTPIDWDCISDVFALEQDGLASYLDYLIVNAKQFAEPSTIDVYVRTFYDTTSYEKALNNEAMVWGTGTWGVAAWYNVDLTDLVGKPKRLKLKKRSPYFQIRFRNNRSERCEIYQYSIEGRVAGG